MTLEENGDTVPISKLVDGFHSRGALPHLKRENGTYFVTFRLAGTLPREVLLQLKAEREAMIKNALAAKRPLTWREQKELFAWYAERVDKYLDSGHGSCWLARVDLASHLASTLNFFVGERYHLHAWVIMPNHVHVVVTPNPPWSLSQILKSWKTYSARESNKLLQRTGETFWQSESYDHLCRGNEDFAHCCEYTVNNPVSAGLCLNPEQWQWSSAYRSNKGPEDLLTVRPEV